MLYNICMPNIKKNDQNSINENDKKELHDAGVDLPGMASSVTPEDLNENKEEVVVDIDDNSNIPVETDLSDTGIKFFDETQTKNKEDLSLLAEQKKKELAASDLEEEFKSQLSTSESVKESEKLVIEKGLSMKRLLSKIREKLGLKKTKVKTELDGLKKMKEGISKDISEIKELEESEQKIEEELKKIDTIKEEMEMIEKEVSEELKK